MSVCLCVCVCVCVCVCMCACVCVERVEQLETLHVVPSATLHNIIYFMTTHMCMTMHGDC